MRQAGSKQGDKRGPLSPARRARAATAKGQTPAESEIHQWWRDGRVAMVPPKGSSAGPLRVIFPGWSNSGRGPDFTGAVVQTPEGSMLRGDVEIHVDDHGWYRHGHHRDPAYDNVALHVVWRAKDTTRSARTSRGRQVPMSIVERAAGSHRRSDARPCVRRADTLEAETIGQTLDHHGDRRFQEKAVSLAARGHRDGADQALYRGLLMALGYSKNTAPFGDLADRLPYPTLSRIAENVPKKRRRATIEGLLFGASGLLPSQREMTSDGSEWVVALEAAWASSGLGPDGPPPAWQCFRLRPENGPVRRVAGAAALVEAFLREGPATALERVLTALGGAPTASMLRQALTIVEHGYWAGHWDFGKRRKHAATLIGADRASDMAVNVVLPFFYGRALLTGDRGLQRLCLETYRAHPPLSSNHVTREMERMLRPGLAHGTIATARRQQGLLRLYGTRCSKLLCDGCPIVP